MLNTLIIIISLFLLAACTDEKQQDNTSQDTIATSEPTPPSESRDMVAPQEPQQKPAAIENNEESFLNNDILIIPPEEQRSENSGESERNIDNRVDSSASSLSSSQSADNSVTSQSSKEDDEEIISEEPTFKVSKNDIVLGDPNSKIVFIEYYSPTCPHCAYYNKATLPELKKKYIDTNKIAYVIREFISNKQDLDAAILQRCTNNVDNFLKFHHLILQQQDKWSTTSKYRELLTNVGQIGGISAEAYEKCLKDNKIIKMLIDNTNLASNSPNFIGTPAFFINGVQILDGYDLQNLTKKLDKALESKNISK